MSEFYDYGTGVVSNKNDLFDTTLTGMSYYNQFLDDPEYMKSAKNLESKIIMLTPQEYFEECAKIFNSSFDKQVKQTSYDADTLKHLKDVIQIAKRKFPLTFLNYAEGTQEGRHRMYTAAELTSWETKFPVLIIDWFDKDKRAAQVEAKRVNDLEQRLDRAISDTLRYNYDPENPDTLYDELQIQMNNAFGNFLDDPDVEFVLQHDESKDIYSVTKDGVTREFQGSDIRWETPVDDELEPEIPSEEDIDAFLAKYL